MLIYEYKADGYKAQYAAIEAAIRTVQFIRNKCLRKWMDGRGVSKNDLQCYCAELGREYPFGSRLNSQARQASADHAWFAGECQEIGVLPNGKAGVVSYAHKIADPRLWCRSYAVREE